MRTPKQTRLQQLNALRRAMNYRDEKGRLRSATIDNLLELRKLMHYNNWQLAQALGVPTRYVAAWCAGDYAPPYDKMELILELLDREIKNAQPENNT